MDIQRSDEYKNLLQALKERVVQAQLRALGGFHPSRSRSTFLIRKDRQTSRRYFDG
jgi:hypothetical protein